VKLTKIAIDKFEYEGDPLKNERDVRWDDELAGLGVRVYPSGKKAFVLSYRVNGRKKMMTIGMYGALTLDQARRRARVDLGKIEAGGDPLSEKKQASSAETVEELCKYYIDKTSVEKRSSYEDQRKVRRYIVPLWGKQKIAAISHQDVIRLHAKIGESSIYEANRTLALISVLWTFAAKVGFIPRTADNPARGVEKFPEIKRGRWVKQEEMPELIKAISNCGDVHMTALFMLYLFTGCRKSELLQARWDFIDFERRELNIPKTKSGEPLHLTLPPEAIALLRSLPREVGNPHIFPGKVPGENRKNVYPIWWKIRKAAGIEDVRIHDLRRTVGSWLKQAGNETYLIQQVLNHKDPRTTARYMHFPNEQLRSPIENHSRRISELTKKSKDQA